MWDWFVIDLSYVLVLVGGSLVFRARGAGVMTWMCFGSLSVFVGTVLFFYTWDAQQALAAATGTDAVGLLEACAP